jgi:FkbM family methyltransferase
MRWRRLAARARRAPALIRAGGRTRDRVALAAYLAEDLVEHVAGRRRRAAGELHVRLGDLDVVVARFASHLGAYLDVWRDNEYGLVPGFRAGPGGVVVDGGANVGFYAMWQAVAVGPSGAVHAFEPNPRSYELLCRNVERNGLSWVRCYQLALTRDGGPVALAGDPRDSSTVKTTAGTGVASVSLDGFAAEHGIGHIDVVKLDTEGAEADIVAGGLEAALPGTDRVVIESHNTRAKVTELLSGVGFVCVHDGYRPNTVYYERHG